MSQQNTLSPVDADLAAGCAPLARQRLRGLVSSFPYDLMLRRRLAEELGRPVDWGDPASYEGDAGEEHVPDGDGWTAGGVLAGLGCLIGAVAFLAVWVVGVVALFA
ncbi:DUF6584 family protein [Streptomyces sp. E-08]|uniref:DUF6584 family protein n=1 Tax=Streptomyces sp. E-08 TaxID=3404047 RepID=UPI003CEB9E4B